MLLLFVIGLLTPCLSFLFLMAFADKLNRNTVSWIGCLSIFISFLSFTAITAHFVWEDLHPIHFHFWKWISVDQVQANIAFTIDPLSLTMALIITGVGFLIHVYSVGYTDHETDFARYFSCLNFFIFAMLILVLASELALLFVGWEGVGLASYLLIGYWYTKSSAAKAATKAFIVNRIGDAGFLVGLLLAFYLFGTSDVSTMSQKITQQFAVGAPIITLMTFLFFVGAIGKSAQLPLHIWLPDAMEGPTPVSALIHAATMVTAGVYLIVRMHDVYMMTPFTLYLVGAVGGITSLYAALSAIGQTDLKRVLAYSTVSQLGLMFLACGVGAFYAAMFHLTTHAFVKALLFLAAGNVVHMMHGVTEMKKMGGLKVIFDKTHWLFLIGVLALSGIPPFAAFFSKDLILEQEHTTGHDVLFYVGLATSTITAFYLMRAYLLTFGGKLRHAINGLHEAPKVMLLPVSMLALLAILGGLLGYRYGRKPPLEDFLDEINITVAKPYGNIFLAWETWLAFAGAIAGIGVAVWLYKKYAEALSKPIEILKNGFYLDQIYTRMVQTPLRELGRYISEILEPKVFEKSLKVTTRGTQVVSHYLQRAQSGEIRSYVAWLVLGGVFFVFYFLRK